jgi:hypothetical protein
VYGVEGVVRAERESAWLQKQRRLLLRLGHVDARVRDVSALLNGDSLSNTPGVLVEHNVLVVLDELASAPAIS